MKVLWEGQPVEARPGQSLAAALWAAGTSELGAPDEPARGLYCGVGHCFACRVVVDGVHGVRACLVEVREGLRAEREPGGSLAATGGTGGEGASDGASAATAAGVGDGAPGHPWGGVAGAGASAATAGSGRIPRVAVLGAGPAGLSAAASLAEAGAEVVVVDEAPAPGGALRLADPARAEALVARARSAGAGILCGASVWGVFPAWRLVLAPTDPGAGPVPAEIAADAVVLATGAAQLPLALPGWTLPGVVTPWGALHLLRAGALPPGSRVAVVGTDVATLAAARLLQAADGGPDLVAVVAPRPGALTVSAQPAPDHLTRGLPVQAGRVAAGFLGRRRLTALRTCAPDGTAQADIAADVAVVGAGLGPLTDAVRLAGAAVARIPALGGFVAVHGPMMEAPIGGLFLAGGVTGVEGSEVAAAQGRLAGLACAAAHGLPKGAAGAPEQLAAAAADVAAARAQAAPTYPSAAAGRAELARLWAAQAPARR